MEEVGALPGRYHATVRQIEVTSQRPGTLPLADVPTVLLSRELDVVPWKSEPSFASSPRNWPAIWTALVTCA